MLTRFTLFLLSVTLLLSLTACGELAPLPKEDAQTAPAAAPKPAEPAGPYYELTKDEITSHPDWTSKNITVLGVKIGDTTPTVVKSFGTQMGETKVLAEDYLSYYQKNGIEVYAAKMTAKTHKMEIMQGFADKVSDPKLKQLLENGDLKLMRSILGMEESSKEELGEMGTEYIYDARGIRFIKYKSGINGLRLSDFTKKP